MNIRKVLPSFVFILLLSQAALAAELYVPHSLHQRLGVVDTATGLLTDVGSFGLPPATVIPALATDTDGTVYGLLNVLRTPTGLSQLVTIDPATARVRPVGFPNTINLLAFGIGPDGTAYAGGFNAPSLGFVGDPNLYRIDKATGQLILIGDTGVEMLMDFAFDSEGTMWGTVGDELYTIDTETGVAQHAVTITGVDAVMTDPDAEIMGIMFDESDVLYATAFSRIEQSPVFIIDTVTGLATGAATPGLSATHGGDIFLGQGPLVSARQQQIRAMGLLWDEAFNAGDLDRLMNYYALEAVSLPPSEPAMDKAALRDHLAWLFDNYTTHHEWNAVEFRFAEDLLVERGEYARSYVPKAGNEPLPDETGKHVVVYTRVDNEWKILWEIWSPDE